MSARQVAVAGAGIAGMTSALALAARGFTVDVFEKAERFEEVGAGLQLSPNATRILDRLGVLSRLRPLAVRPEAVLLKRAADLGPLARVPLGLAGEERWRAPYLVAHRADLQAALLARVREVPAISLRSGGEVAARAEGGGRLAASVETGGRVRGIDCAFLVGADGVWSRLRQAAGGGPAIFSGHVALRTVVDARDSAVGILARDSVTAFLAPRSHLVAYPVRGGDEINLVAVVPGRGGARGWANAAETEALDILAAGASPALATLLRSAGTWTSWPLYTAPAAGPWTHAAGLALVGDAAHALTPFAAQGAAMAIEDAALVAAVAGHGMGATDWLAEYERLRRPRVARVARRGAFNRFVWHARGPMAAARDLALRLSRPERLAADLDWLYGHDVEAAAAPAKSELA